MAVMYSQNGVIIRPNDNFNVIGGKKYKTVQMPDGKIWLAENLDFKFCNISGSGSPTTANAWYYDNNETTYGWEGKRYGLLYNWYAVKLLNDNRSELCPEWHVPSTTEWDTLVDAVGGANNAGTVLKSTTNWIEGAGTDNYGFTAFPTGRYYDDFDYVGYCSGFWTTTEDGSSKAYREFLDEGASISAVSYNKTLGYSLRLVRDSN